MNPNQFLFIGGHKPQILKIIIEEIDQNGYKTLDQTLYLLEYVNLMVF